MTPNKILESKILDKTITSIETDAKEIKTYCFSYCTSLTSFIGNRVKTIKEHAFEGCSSLTILNFPSVSKLEVSCFLGVNATINLTSLKRLFVPIVASNSTAIIHLPAIETLETGSTTSAEGPLSRTQSGTYYIGKTLKEVTKSPFKGTTTSNTTYPKVYFDHGADDPVLFSIANFINNKGSSKSTFTYYFYTDNATIKNGLVAGADSYTIINVYHLDGSAWE